MKLFDQMNKENTAELRKVAVLDIIQYVRKVVLKLCGAKTARISD